MKVTRFPHGFRIPPRAAPAAGCGIAAGVGPPPARPIMGNAAPAPEALTI